MLVCLLPRGEDMRARSWHWHVAPPSGAQAQAQAPPGPRPKPRPGPRPRPRPGPRDVSRAAAASPMPASLRRLHPLSSVASRACDTPTPPVRTSPALPLRPPRRRPSASFPLLRSLSCTPASLRQLPPPASVASRACSALTPPARTPPALPLRPRCRCPSAGVPFSRPSPHGHTTHQRCLRGGRLRRPGAPLADVTPPVSPSCDRPLAGVCHTGAPARTSLPSQAHVATAPPTQPQRECPSRRRPPSGCQPLWSGRRPPRLPPRPRGAATDTGSAQIPPRATRTSAPPVPSAPSLPRQRAGSRPPP